MLIRAVPSAYDTSETKQDEVVLKVIPITIYSSTRIMDLGCLRIHVELLWEIFSMSSTTYTCYTPYTWGSSVISSVFIIITKIDL
jgi:hypothetical protein